MILGDDGIRYSFTTQGWRDDSLASVEGMAVEFENRGTRAVSVSPAPGYQPSASAPTPQRASRHPSQRWSTASKLPSGDVPPKTSTNPIGNSAPAGSVIGVSGNTASGNAPAQTGVSGVQNTLSFTERFDWKLILVSIGWMLLIDNVLVWLPLLSSFIAGLVGGWKAKSIPNSVLASIGFAILEGYVITRFYLTMMKAFFGEPDPGNLTFWYYSQLEAVIANPLTPILWIFVPCVIGAVIGAFVRAKKQWR